MEKYICECCGGQINSETMKCMYCGTQYKREYNPRDDRNNIIRVETFFNPVRTYTACVDIDDRYVRELGAERVSELAIKELAAKLAESLIPNMVIHSTNDIRSFGHKVYGIIKMVQPVNGAENWRDR